MFQDYNTIFNGSNIFWTWDFVLDMGSLSHLGLIIWSVFAKDPKRPQADSEDSYQQWLLSELSLGTHAIL